MCRWAKRYGKNVSAEVRLPETEIGRKHNFAVETYSSDKKYKKA